MGSPDIGSGSGEVRRLLLADALTVDVHTLLAHSVDRRAAGPEDADFRVLWPGTYEPAFTPLESFDNPPKRQGLVRRFLGGLARSGS